MSGDKLFHLENLSNNYNFESQLSEYNEAMEIAKKVLHKRGSIVTWYLNAKIITFLLSVLKKIAFLCKSAGSTMKNKMDVFPEVCA